MTPRRFYLLKARAAHQAGEHAIEGGWLAKARDQPGTPLPDDLPGRAVLVAAGYLAIEDLVGATDDELRQLGLTLREVAAVLAAIT